MTRSLYRTKNMIPIQQNDTFSQYKLAQMTKAHKYMYNSVFILTSPIKIALSC
jgi:hypothetical protein